MPFRPALLTVVLLGSCLLGLTACRERTVTTYRVPKEAPPAASSAANPSATTNTGDATPAAQPGAATPPAPGLPAADGATMANTAVPTASGLALTWTAPAQWSSRPASAMRKATYLIPGDGATAELAITAFPGDVGGNLANVNRWRGQLQLAPLDATALDAALNHLDANGLHLDWVELIGPVGPTRQRVLGAIVPWQGSTWFFKLTGPDALVAAEKANFVTFLSTIRPPAAP